MGEQPLAFQWIRTQVYLKIAVRILNAESSGLQSPFQMRAFHRQSVVHVNVVYNALLTSDTPLYAHYVMLLKHIFLYKGGHYEIRMEG